jgi:Transposase protein
VYIYIKQIKSKVNAMTNEEKYCVIGFDEMSIKKYLEYSKYLDIVEGYEDFGHLGRTNKLATHTLVFIARGLYAKWKLPIAYFLSASSTKSLF